MSIRKNQSNRNRTRKPLRKLISRNSLSVNKDDSFQRKYSVQIDKFRNEMASKGIAWDRNGVPRKMSNAEMQTVMTPESMEQNQPVTDDKKKINKGLIIALFMAGIVVGAGILVKDRLADQWENLTVQDTSTSAPVVEPIAQTFYDLPQDAKDLFRGVETTVEPIVETIGGNTSRCQGSFQRNRNHNYRTNYQLL
ncbi:MAG: hypothetical protein HeimC2_40260 [Candidatus Heimdallarchaeota archaeon LC_2]|nr:MAG: hypothetical protein HeimC2_40260 [Candidatus Heimdallarchaeota archaeon LC_2]